MGGSLSWGGLVVFACVMGGGLKNTQTAPPASAAPRPPNIKAVIGTGSVWRPEACVSFVPPTSSRLIFGPDYIWP